jgi:hypothetical protein
VATAWLIEKFGVYKKREVAGKRRPFLFAGSKWGRNLSVDQGIKKD